MSIKGNVISRLKDATGEILIIEQQHKRILTFDGVVEQSSAYIHEPSRLVHKYTQAMMTALLFLDNAIIKPTITVTGLGAGSMVNCLLEHLPSSRVHAIEIRQKVIEAAKTYFQLNSTRRLTIHHNDAIRYMANNPVNSDIVFSDIYTPRGMDPKQVQKSYLKNCKKHLNENGILVLNLWHENFSSAKQIRALLDDVFSERILIIAVEGGNTIVLAFKNEIPRHGRKILLEKADKLSLKLGVPVKRYAQLLWSQHKSLL